VAAKSKAEKEKKVKAAESNAAPAGPGAIAAGGGLGAVPAGDEWPDKDAEPVPVSRGCVLRGLSWGLCWHGSKICR
jgi:hypothetical protein